MTSVQAMGLGRLDDVLAVVTGSAPAGGSYLAGDVRTWLASPEQGLAAAVEPVAGAEASTAALARLAPSRLTVAATAGSDRACWAEIARRTDAGAETCIAGLTHDPDGRVCRLVWLRAPLVPPCDPETVDTDTDARPVLESYFAALMNSRFREAAAHFTTDALYSHPPYTGGQERVLFRGRNALLHGFQTERGPSPARQIITDLWQRGARVFVEGVIDGIPNGGTFFSTAEINQACEISRYVAFYSATRIPRPR